MDWRMFRKVPSCCYETSRGSRAKWMYFYCMVATISFVVIVTLHLTAPHSEPHVKDINIKYILQWTSPHMDPFRYMGRGRDNFIKYKCIISHCYVTPDQNYFADITDFDAVAFGPEIMRDFVTDPPVRSPKQKYIFVSLESSDIFTPPDYYKWRKKYQNFFNWTWTYRLDSDVPYNYLVARDNSGEVVAPSVSPRWMKPEEMKPAGKDVREAVKTKDKAVAWLVSNCQTRSKREEFVGRLQAELQLLGLSVDVYGKCGTRCGLPMMQNCWELIQTKYHFYLSFENSFNQDYVTEKLLNPLTHYTVPIVYGTANYTRFMPDGMYLNAKELGERRLAKEIRDIMNDKERYLNFFRWRNHYSYHYPEEAPDTSNYCQLCAALHDRAATDTTTVYNDFLTWWNPLE